MNDWLKGNELFRELITIGFWLCAVIVVLIYLNWYLTKDR